MESPNVIAPYKPKPYTLAGLTFNEITTEAVPFLCHVLITAPQNVTSQSLARQQLYYWTRALFKDLQVIDFEIMKLQRQLRAIGRTAQRLQVGGPHNLRRTWCPQTVALRDASVEQLVVKLIPKRQRKLDWYVAGMDVLVWLETECAPEEEWTEEIKKAHRDYLLIPPIMAVNEARAFFDDPRNDDGWPRKVQDLDAYYHALFCRSIRQWPSSIPRDGLCMTSGPSTQGPAGASDPSTAFWDVHSTLPEQ